MDSSEVSSIWPQSVLGCLQLRTAKSRRGYKTFTTQELGLFCDFVVANLNEECETGPLELNSDEFLV